MTDFVKNKIENKKLKIWNRKVEIIKQLDYLKTFLKSGVKMVT